LFETETRAEDLAEAVAVTELNSQTLADLIAKRHHCLVKLRGLGCKQSELIAAGNMGSLLRLLSAKNQWIVAVQTIEKELTPYHEQDPDTRVWASEAARSQCARQAAECKQLLAEVMQMEQQNEQKMTERRDKVANQLQMAHAAGSVCSAYQAQQSTRKVGPQAVAHDGLPSTTSANQLPTSHQ
jgi:hypothetical protein